MLHKEFNNGLRAYPIHQAVQAMGSTAIIRKQKASKSVMTKAIRLPNEEDKKWCKEMNAQLLIEEGIISKEKFFAKLKEVQAQYQVKKS